MDNKTMAARIKALLAKTTENGCTEAEAMAAAMKARELMDTYQIDLGAVGMEAEGVTQSSTPNTSYKTFGIRWRLALRVMEYCDVKCWKKGDNIVFFGLQSDADFATWLLETLDAFIQRSAGEFMHKVKPADLPTGVKMPRWEAEKAFVLGAIHRICQRLFEETLARKAKMRAGTGTSLVVVKGAMVEKAFGALGLRMRTGGKSKTNYQRGNAYEAGVSAGDRASFGRPVNGGGGTKLLS